jgi:hypothetical protein
MVFSEAEINHWDSASGYRLLRESYSEAKGLRRSTYLKPLPQTYPDIRLQSSPQDQSLLNHFGSRALKQLDRRTFEAGVQLKEITFDLQKDSKLKKESKKRHIKKTEDYRIELGSKITEGLKFGIGYDRSIENYLFNYSLTYLEVNVSKLQASVPDVKVDWQRPVLAKFPQP